MPSIDWGKSMSKPINSCKRIANKTALLFAFVYSFSHLLHVEWSVSIWPIIKHKSSRGGPPSEGGGVIDHRLIFFHLEWICFLFFFKFFCNGRLCRSKTFSTYSTGKNILVLVYLTTASFFVPSPLSGLFFVFYLVFLIELT